jgi:hypothetical protein
MLSQLFGIIPAGHPLISEPSSVPSQTSFIYSLPTDRPFSHITVFILPGITLPSNTAAAIYIASASETATLTNSGQAPNFRFLGAVGPGKESAVFKVAGLLFAPGDGVVIGISVEAGDTIAARIQDVSAGSTMEGPSVRNQSSTLLLAQNIIKNAFNFLASFSGTAGPGHVEVVPLKAFEEWWRKFESKVRADPGFLEKQTS